MSIEINQQPTFRDKLKGIAQTLADAPTTEVSIPVNPAAEARAALHVLEAMQRPANTSKNEGVDIAEVRTALKLKIHEELKDERYLQTQKERASSQIAPERQQQLNEQALQLVDEEELTAFTKEILDALEKNGTYGYVANYIKETMQQLAEISSEWEQLTTRQRQEKLRTLRASTSLTLRSGVKLNIYDILPHAQANSLSRDAQLGKSNIYTQRAVTQAHEFLSSPATPILIIRDIESKGALERHPIESYAHVLSDTESEAATQFAAAVEWYALQRIFEQISQNTQLTPVEKKYLNAHIAQTLVEHGTCSASLARELMTGGIIPGENPLLDVIKTFIKDEQVSQKKKVSKWTRLALTGLTALSIIGGQYISTPQGRNELKNKVVFVADFMKGIFTSKQNDATPEDPLFDQPTVSQAQIDALVQEAQKKREAESQSENSRPETSSPRTPTPEASIPPHTPDRQFNGDKITQDNLSWSEADFGLSNRSTQDAGIDAEGFLRANTKIDWIITENKYNTNISHLIQNIKTRYDGTTDNYRSIENPATFEYTVPSDTTNADIQMLAKRRYFSDEIIKLSVPPGMHVSSAEVTAINIGNDTSRTLDLSVQVSEVGEYALIVDPLAIKYDEVIEIRVGFAAGTRHALSENFFQRSVDDETLKDLSILPTELQALIGNLNNTQELTDYQKLSALKQWFQERQIYSMDDRYTNYYTARPFSFENYYRRYFGTGNSGNDPAFINNPDLPYHATCEPHHEAYLFAARFLTLTDGIPVFLEGYLNNGVYGTEGSIITQGSAHGFAGYLSRTGELLILDVQPLQMDDYTRQLLSRLPRNPSINQTAGQSTQLEAYRQLSFWAKEPWSGAPRRERVTPPINISYDTPWIDQLREAFESKYRYDLQIGDWRMMKSGYEMNWIGQGELTTGINSNFFDGNEIMNDSYWRITPLNQTFLTYRSIIEILERRKIDIPKSPNGEPNLEDLATVYQGRVTIEGNTVALPSAGVVSPRSIRVVEIATDEHGNEYQLPAPISHIIYRPNGITGYDYQLVLDLSAQEIEGKIYQIEYATMSSMELPIIPMSESEIDTVYRLRPKDIFGSQFAQFLTALDEADSLSDLLDLRSHGVIFPESFLSEEDLNRTYDEGSLAFNRLKTLTIGFYLSSHYTLSGSPERSKVGLGEAYFANEVTWSDYIKNITSVSGTTIDPYTANYLFIKAAQTIRAQGKEHGLPVALVSSTFSSHKDRSTGKDLTDLGKDFQLWSEQFSTRTPKFQIVLYEYTPGNSENGVMRNPEGLFAAQTIDLAYMMEVDPLTKDAIADVVKENIHRYQSPDQLRAAAEYIVRHDLSDGERTRLTIAETVSLWWQDYRDNYNGKYKDYALALLALTLTEEFIRRSMSKYRRIDANKVRELIEQAQSKYDVAQLESSPVWQHITMLDERIFRHRHAATVQRDDVSLRGPYTWQYLTLHDKGFLTPATLEIFKRYLTLGNTFDGKILFEGKNDEFIGEAKLTDIAITNSASYDAVTVELARLWLWAAGKPWAVDVMLDQHTELFERSGYHIDSYKGAIQDAIKMPEDKAQEYLQDWIRGLYPNNSNLADYLTNQIIIPIYTLARQEKEQLIPAKK